LGRLPHPTAGSYALGTLVAEISNGDGHFPTTRHSAVRGAHSDDVAERERSWKALVEAYWKPAYKHARIQWRLSREDAQDALQDFFARAMEKGFFQTFDLERGRFRTFFRTCLDRHVSNATKAQGREKRGGGAQVLSLDFEGAEHELAVAGASAWESPETCFDREWRRHLLGLAVESLRDECEATGKQTSYAVFQRYDLCEGERPTYEALGRDLGIEVTTVTNQLAWARRALRRHALQRLEALTVNDEELREEARKLLG
jgi:RNA polymerase sigma factor (sigma-70 family)